MSHGVNEKLQNTESCDELDRVPKNITITTFDLFWYVVAIVGHFVDLGIDINIAVRYYMTNMMPEFGWTLVFILLPGIVNTAVSIRMYSLDKQDKTESDLIKKRKWLRNLMLIILMAPTLRVVHAFIYALKSRRAERKKDPVSQRMHYLQMLKEDSDAALLRIFECFLEAAPQMVLQTGLLLQQHQHLTLHQGLSILSSIISLMGMGWCLASFQRAIRYPQPDKLNIRWFGSVLQTLWHFFITMSRVSALSTVAYLFPYWLVGACGLHTITMALFIHIQDTPHFCNHHILASVLFSLALGAVYLFTYIPAKSIDRTRYRYISYYTICFIENIACAIIWYLYCDMYEPNMRNMVYYIGFLVISTLPFCFGILFMVIYYLWFHPTRRGVNEVLESTVPMS